MFKITRNQPWPPMVDLATIHETLSYMKSDADRVPGLEAVSQALSAALVEVEKAERKSDRARLSPSSAKFLPARLVPPRRD